MNSFIIEQLKKANVIDATGKVTLANLNTYTLTHDILVIITDVVENNETVSYLRAVIDRWTMQDKAMGEQFITFNLTTEAPIEWAVGDYCYFRGERYTLNYIPSVTQSARTRTAQDAYTYDSVKMDSFLEELTRCEILDIVSTSDQHDPDLGTNYTGSSKFTLFCGENIVTVGGEPQTRTAVCTLADKIQVNLDRMYGVGTWKILVNTIDYYTDATGRNVLVTHTDNREILFDHKTAAEALAEVHNTFDLNYYYEGNRVIKIGYDMGNVTDEDGDEIYAFGYGQGYPTKTDQHKGLFELRKISNSQQQIVTRLRVYGSTKNLPYKWYFDHYDNLPQSLIINNLQLPDTFLPEGNPVNPDPNTKRAHNATRPTLRAVLGPKNDAYIDKNDDAASCPEGIREASVAFDGSNSELEEIYPSIEGVTFGGLRQATGLKDLDNIYTPNQNAFAGYNNDEDINTLLAVGYTQGGVLFDDANVGSGILPKEGDTMPGSIFQVPYSTSGFETLTEGTNYYYGQEQTLFTVTPTKKGKYFIVPVLGKEPYFNFYTPTGSLQVGFIIKVKQGSNVIAQYQSDYSAINSGYFELPTIPDVFKMEDARTPEINVTTLSSHSITFTPIVKKETSGLTVQLSYNISAQGETWAYVPEYDWCAASQVDSSNEPFHIFVKDMGFDIKAQLNGETPMVVMKTGDCVGREFVIGEDIIPITYQGKKGYRLTLTRASDSSLNTYYPSESYQLKDGDYFVLTGIDMPEAYINAAEVRLLRAATVWMAENGDTKFKYQPAIDDIYLKRNYDNMVAATPPTPEKSVFWRLRAGRTVKFRDVPSSASGQPSDITVKIDTITITMGAELTRKVDILLNDDITQSTLQKTVSSVSSLTTKVEALGTGLNSLVTPEMMRTYTNTNYLSKVHDDVAAGAIRTRKWFIGDLGVAAGGVLDLSMGGGGGQGTVTGINFAGSPGTIYEPSDGLITLPDYPSLSGYATQSYVGTYFSSHFTQSSIKTTLGISDWALAASKPSYNFSEIGSKPTTLAGYGITDANITSGVITLGGNTITPATLSNGKIPLSQIPDAILGQMLYGGTVDGSGVVALSQNAKDKWGITTLTLTSSNYSDYEGAYFIASANGSSGVPSTLGVLTGDWVVATASGWGKIDNTDAVTGVKGDAETDYRIGNVNITKANIGLGNVENTALSTWIGSGYITTLGVITTGEWNGNPIDKNYLASDVQTSLGKADTALQSHQTIYSLTIKKNGTQVGSTYNPASAAQTIDITDVASASALSGVTTRVGTLEGYFDGNGNANNAVNLDGHDSSYYATATGLSGLSGRVGTLEGYFTDSVANNALRLSNTEKIGDTNQPVYFTANGVPAAISYTIGRNVAAGEDVTAYTAGSYIAISNHVVAAKEASASQGGVVTTSPQTFAGDKTFTGHVRSNKSVRGDLGVIAGGVGSLNIGGGGGTGTVTSVSVNNGTHTLPNDEGNVNLVLAAVALSGNYNDLSNKPTIPTKASWDYDDRYVRYDTNAQGLTDTQKANARTNIGAIAGINASMVNTALGFTLSGTSGQTYNLATISSNASNGNTAYGWGNHADAGYVKAATDDTISGLKTFSHGIFVQGRVYNIGDDEGIVIKKAANGYAGVTLIKTSITGIHSTFYLDASDKARWVYNNGTTSNSIYHPEKGGTIALTTDIPTKLSDLTDDLGSEPTHTHSQYLTGITSSMVTTALEYTPFNNASFTQSNIKTTLGISDWALAASKPSYTHNEIGAGNAIIGDGTYSIYLRTTGGWASSIYHHSKTDEAVVFLNMHLEPSTNYTTSWIFAYGTPSDRPDWDNLTPAMQIKGQSVVINKLLRSRVGASYNLDVNGSINGTSIYLNGTALGSASTHAHGDYMTAISYDANNKKISWAKGGVEQTAFTVGYATSSNQANYTTSVYRYTGSSTYDVEGESITDSMTSDALMRDFNGTLYPVFHLTDWGWSDTLYWSGLDKWGGTELATQYNAGSNVRVKIRKYNQTISGWGDWTEFITSGNIGSQSVNYATSAGNATNDSDGNAINTTYLKKSGGAMTGMITWDGGNAINFRTGHTAYNAIIGYYTPGNEALVIGLKHAVTSFIVKSGVDLTGKTDWQSSTIGTPSIQVKGQSLYVNCAIAQDEAPFYNFYVGGSMGISGQITSTVATGTAPLVVASTTAVSNLNADLLDGQHASHFHSFTLDDMNVYTKQDYERVVILLCKLSSRFSATNETSEGTICYTQVNGITAKLEAHILMVDNYEADYGFRYSIFSNCNNFNTTDKNTGEGYRVCKFQYNGEWYGGLEFHTTQAGTFSWHGNTAKPTFISYLKNNTLEVLNSEIYNSIVFTGKFSNQDYELIGNAASATALRTSRSIWGHNFNGTADVSGDMSSVGNISFSASGKNMGGTLYFDTTNHYLGVNKSAPDCALDVDGVIHATKSIVSKNGGVIAGGIGSLSMSGVGGGGTVNGIKFGSATAITPDDDGILNVPSLSAGIITQDATHRMVSDSQVSTWNSKADGEHTHSQYIPKYTSANQGRLTTFTLNNTSTPKVDILTGNGSDSLTLSWSPTAKDLLDVWQYVYCVGYVSFTTPTVGAGGLVVLPSANKQYWFDETGFVIRYMISNVSVNGSTMKVLFIDTNWI